jgi:hypothetical protein
VPRSIGEEGGSGHKGHLLGDCLRYRVGGVRCLSPLLGVRGAEGQVKRQGVTARWGLEEFSLTAPRKSAEGIVGARQRAEGLKGETAPAGALAH